MERVRFKWAAPIANLETGQALTLEVSAYWSPDFEGVRNSVSEAACAMAYVESGKTQKFVANGLPELLPA